MKFLSVVIPAYNEGDRMVPTLQAIAAYLQGRPYRWEIVVVNDGSRDDTASRANFLKASIPQLRIISHVSNQGKGAAVRTGLLEAKGEVVLFCDADLATPMKELEKLLPELESGVGFVVASRRLPASEVVSRQPGLRHFMSGFYPRICRMLLRSGVRDVTCGFKLLSAPAAQMIASRMRITRWSFDAEMFTIARLHGIQVAEVPIRWADQGKSKVHLGRDAWGSFRELLQIRSNAKKGLYR